ncbi:unnamed protein product [Phytophthora lilii]|uniref:Unnamed protein product n=1 Tax=Phytophthora lilii TaxID=2077276 RepID=A0A9W6TVI6_9STRA|nr:unnamed protein product [Phytophthora lilii]
MEASLSSGDVVTNEYSGDVGTRDWLELPVSTLVLSLNQHWWSQTNTCFKQSRSTPNSSFCRYGFPKEPVTDTKFTASGVKMSRPIGHEYVNGFNDVLMATFKCNHDIQVLLGGQEATHRIHYCCKPQRRFDSPVAIALGAFKRRQERERLENSPTGGGAKEKLANARKRVASMVYSVTNRQEAAGPLAALYYSYRGSCCYSSAGCISLPLEDSVRQLCASDEYSCRLVKECDSSGSCNFHAVSSLDDYIYRPRSLTDVNLYQFTMRYFRKQDKHANDAPLPFLRDHRLCKGILEGSDAVFVWLQRREERQDAQADRKQQAIHTLKKQEKEEELYRIEA